MSSSGGRKTAKPGDTPAGPPPPEQPTRKPSTAESSSGVTAAAATATKTTPTSPTADSSTEAELLTQSKDFLVRRVMALERQMKIRNADCARLLQERHQLLPLKDKCESQKEMILALKDQLSVLQVEKASALESMEAMRKERRDEEHTQRVQHAEQMVGPRPVAAATAATHTMAHDSCPTNARPRKQSVKILSVQDAPPPPNRPPGGTVIQTSLGPQIVYNSSDISSVGFSKQTRPMDFLGGAGAANTLAGPAAAAAGDRHNNNNESGGGGSGDVFNASEEAEVQRLMAMAKEDAELDIKYAGLQDEEERALRARLEALKTRK